MPHLPQILTFLILAGILACASQPTPAATVPPSPTNPPTTTVAPEPTLTATPEPTPTATPNPTPTATPKPAQLDEIPCGPDCVTSFQPASSKVAWLEKPNITATGRLSFVVRIDAGHTLVIPDLSTTYPNVVLSENAVAGTDPLYGMVVPPLSGGYHWTPEPGLWIADVYEYRRADNTLQVAANIDPTAASHRGLRVCIWTGGTGATPRILGCKVIN